LVAFAGKQQANDAGLEAAKGEAAELKRAAAELGDGPWEKFPHKVVWLRTAENDFLCGL